MTVTQALQTRLANRPALTRLSQTIAIELALLALVWKLLRLPGSRIVAAHRRCTGASGERANPGPLPESGSRLWVVVPACNEAAGIGATAWGPRRTLLWYWDRRYLPANASAMIVR